MKILKSIFNLFNRQGRCNPLKLIAITRDDIWIRYEFIKLYATWRANHKNGDIQEFIKNSINEQYPRFISDNRRTPAIPLEPVSAMTNFINLYEEIKLNGWDNVPPVSVRKDKSLITLIDGAHRVAIALCLKINSIPISIVESNINPLDYTTFLKNHGYKIKQRYDYGQY